MLGLTEQVIDFGGVGGSLVLRGGDWGLRSATNRQCSCEVGGI